MCYISGDLPTQTLLSFPLLYSGIAWGGMGHLQSSGFSSGFFPVP
jgi:hypothetical protein